MSNIISMIYCTAPEFARIFSKIQIDQHRRYDLWYDNLQQMGITAAHPNDGWVDRKNDVVTLAYPKMILQTPVGVGCLLAIGNPNDYMVVRLIEKIKNRLDPDSPMWRFESRTER